MGATGSGDLPPVKASGIRSIGERSIGGSRSITGNVSALGRTLAAPVRGHVPQGVHVAKPSARADAPPVLCLAAQRSGRIDVSFAVDARDVATPNTARVSRTACCQRRALLAPSRPSALISPQRGRALPSMVHA
jgi:hypothetical protein